MTDKRAPLKNSLAKGALPSLESLEQRIQKAKGEPETPEKQGNQGIGMQIISDLAAGMGVGLAMGYLLDRWLETSPWLLLLCFSLGTAAGFRLVYRTIQRGEK